MPIIVKDLSFVYMKKTPYEHKALDNLNLTVADGEFFGIIGATGSGKSTFIQHLNALIRVGKDSGEIYVDDMKLHEKKLDLKRLRSTVGMVFQYPEYQLFDETVEKDVGFGPKNLGLSQTEVFERVKEAIEICGLNFEEVRNRSPFELSGGEKRRVAIAGVVAMRPKILVLDEPTAGLDPEGRRDILRLIKQLQGHFSPTILMVSHNMDEIARYADKIAVFKDGKAEIVLPPKELFKNRSELEAIGLGVPSVVRIWEELKENGVDVPMPLTPEELAKSLALYKQNNPKNTLNTVENDPILGEKEGFFEAESAESDINISTDDSSTEDSENGADSFADEKNDFSADDIDADLDIDAEADNFSGDALGNAGEDEG